MKKAVFFNQKKKKYQDLEESHMNNRRNDRIAKKCTYWALDPKLALNDLNSTTVSVSEANYRYSMNLNRGYSSPFSPPTWAFPACPRGTRSTRSPRHRCKRQHLPKGSSWKNLSILRCPVITKKLKYQLSFELWENVFFGKPCKFVGEFFFSSNYVQCKNSNWYHG